MLAGRLTSRFPSITALLLACASLSAAPPQDPQRERQLQRAEIRFASAQEERDVAYRELLAEYRSCQAWIERAEDAPEEEPPQVIERWLRLRELPETAWETERTRLAQEGPFHELWNQELYKRARSARSYRETQEKLERAFHALEKLRHPERYQRGFEQTPTGMALIPGGVYPLVQATGYLIGHPDLQADRELKVDAFYLDRREVSCAEFARFLLSLPPALREEHLPSAWGWSEEGSPIFPDGWGGLPVSGVTWSSASSYAEWTGKRLPTEDEWQAAAAGFGVRRYPIGDRFDAAKINCQAHGAGAALPSNEITEDHTPQGVIGMSGNVREWCADLFEERGGADRSKPVDEAGPTTMAVARGGSFRDNADACQSSYRWLFPALGTRLASVGFRCAMDVQ
ncbi:MAG: SUMF1/EgtB/PvdO family nonheme iron enzyme [Planctomycetes bacterium]|nr:SUMF1/EgtB/PvdO family nonheme iron enzyme [Planctomycetota bacterium]